MNKLKLNLEELSVDSFEAVESARPQGTVQGQEMLLVTNNTACAGSCPGQTCIDLTCGPSVCHSSPCAC
jgi:hypothetical protein